MRRRLVSGSLALLFAFGLMSCAAPQSRGVTADEQKVFANNDQVLINVEFSDAAIGRKVAISYEPLEVDYAAGRLSTDLTLEQFADLRARESELGIRVSVDQVRSEAQTKLIQQLDKFELTGVRTQAISGYTCYRTVEETFTTAQNIVTNYPNLAAWTDVGDTWQKTQNSANGYDMRVLKLTNKNITGTKPVLFVISAIHAREYTTAELMTRFAEELVTKYGTDADITWALDHHEVHLMLQANPDGRKKAEAGASWRKNNNTTACTSRTTKGVDLNRNSSFEWNTGGSSANQCDLTYRGPSAASEPETRAIEAYARSVFPDARGANKTDAAPASTSGLFLTMHSYSELVIWPWGNTNTVAPNGTAMQTLGRKFAYFNNYTPQQSIGLYATSGTTDDFVYGELGVAAFTFELGTSFFQPCSDFTSTILPRNLNSLKYALKVARAPYQLPAGPEAISVAVSGSTLTATLNDARFNNSNGTEPSQTVASAEYFIDTPPWKSGATAIAMSASDGSFSSSSEGVTATVNTANLSSGKHIIFVRGKDSSNNVGPVSAVFLTKP
jgi:carboxypeptidase T